MERNVQAVGYMSAVRMSVYMYGENGKTLEQAI
jgi:hypothetical protein